jgi:ribosome-associated protein
MKKTDSKKNDLKKKALKQKALKQQVSEAIQACQEKKAEQLSVLELEQGTGAFTDYFVVCSGTNPRQIQAISDEVELRLKRAGVYPNSIEGYKQAEWVLLDYVDFVIHIFSEASRRYYDLERLWKSAKKVEPTELVAKPRKRAVAKKAVKKRA